MADKNVTMRVAVEGDSAFKSSLSRCNTEIKSMESALKLVQATYQDSANSEEALRAKSDALANVLEKVRAKINVLESAQKNAQNSETSWKTTIAQLQTSLESTQNAIAGMSRDAQNYGTQWNSLSAQLKNAEAELARLGRSTGDTSAEEEALNQKIGTLKSQMENLNTATSGTAQKAGELMQQEKNLGTQLSDAENKLQRASNRVNYYGEQINKAKIQEANFSAEQKKTSQYLNEAANSADKTATSINNEGKIVKQNTQTTKENAEAQNQAQEAYSALTSFLMMSGLQNAFQEIANAMKQCVSASADFNYTMATVEAVSGATSEDMNALNAQAIEWSTSTIYTAQEVADAYTVMGRAGMESSEMLDSLPGVINLAAAAGEDLDSMASTIVNNLNAFGESADQAGRYADVLAETAGDSNTTVAQLADAFTQCASTAGTLGYSIEDTSTLLGMMANRGITGAAAGTQLSVALTRMAGGTQAAADQLEELGVSMFDDEGEARDLIEFFTDLRNSMSGMTDEEKILVEKTLGGQRGMRGLGAIINATDEEFQQLTDSINNSSGAAEEMADTQLDNLEGDTKLLESALEALEIEIGDQLSPTLRNLAQDGTSVLTWLKNFIAENDTAVPTITAAATALGTFVTAMSAAAALKGGVAALTTLFGESLGPIALGCAAVAAAIGGIVAGVTEWNNIQEVNAESANKVAESQTAYEETAASMASQESEVSGLVARLGTLTSATSLSVAQQKEAQGIVDELNGLLPDLGLTYDEATNAINMNTDAIIENARAAAAEEEIAALQDVINEAVAAQIKEEVDLAEAKDDLAEAQAAQTEAETAYQEALRLGDEDILSYKEDLNDANADLADAQDRLTREQTYYDELGNKIEDTANQIDALTGSTDDAADSTEDLADEQTAAAAAAEEEAEANEEARATLKEIEDEIRNASGSGDELMDKYEELEKEYEKLDGAGSEWRRSMVEQELESLKLTAMAVQLSEQLPMLGDSYENLATVIEASGYSVDDFVKSYTDSLDTMLGGFDELEYDTDDTLKSWLSSMDKRTEVTKAWNNNMSAITNALSDGTIVEEAKPAYQEAIQTIMDGGVETYGQVASDLATAIKNNDSKTAWALVNSVNAAGDQARAAAVNQFALATGQTTEKIEELLDAEALTIAEDGSIKISDASAVAAAGIDTGISDQTDTATAAATTLISSVADAVLESDTSEAFTNAGKALIQYMCDGITAKGDDVTSALKSVISTATFHADTVAITQAKNIGTYLDAGIASGITANASRVTSAMAGVITRAVNTAKAKAGISSPSKVMRDQVGQWLPAGVAEGIKANQQTVDQAMSGLMTSVKDKAKTTLPVTTNNNQQMTMNVTVNATEKQSAKEVANEVMSLVNSQIRRKKGAWA